MPRTSGLQSPIMELTGEMMSNIPQYLHADEAVGHTGEVFATRFDTTGHLIASGSMDRSISTGITSGWIDIGTFY